MTSLPELVLPAHLDRPALIRLFRDLLDQDQRRFAIVFPEARIPSDTAPPRCESCRDEPLSSGERVLAVELDAAHRRIDWLVRAIADEVNAPNDHPAERGPLAAALEERIRRRLAQMNQWNHTRELIEQASGYLLCCGECGTVPLNIRSNQEELE